MSQFDELHLTWWQKEDIADLFKEYPELENMNAEELDQFARKLYWEAMGLIEQANALENKGDILCIYLQAIKE